MAYHRKKRKDADAEFIDDSDAGSDEDRRKPTTKEAKREDTKDNSEDGRIACELSKNRKVVVKQFKSMILVDIREFWSNKGGDQKPGKKGISLTVEQWKALKDHVKDVDDVINDFS